MATLLNPHVAPPSPWLLLIGFVVVFSIFVRAYSTRSRTSLPLPPGPPPLPFLGNVLDFPKKHLGPEFHALSQKYGASSLHRI